MMILKHKFVDLVPDVLENGVIYISIEYCSAIHKCVCGCGNEVVTPLSPNDWKLTFDGKHVSLSPSIGNWNLDCKSHYWIINNEIRYASKWYDEKFKNGSKKEGKKKKKKFIKWFHI